MLPEEVVGRRDEANEHHKHIFSRQKHHKNITTVISSYHFSPAETINDVLLLFIVSREARIPFVMIACFSLITSTGVSCFLLLHNRLAFAFLWARWWLFCIFIEGGPHYTELKSHRCLVFQSRQRSQGSGSAAVQRYTCEHGKCYPWHRDGISHWEFHHADISIYPSALWHSATTGTRHSLTHR